MSEPLHRVGIVGLGRMGLPIAVNLMAAGFDVIGYRRHGSPELLEAGGKTAASPAEVAADADILLSILPDADAVEEVVFGPSGTATTVRPGMVHIEMSTIDAVRKAQMRDRLRKRGAEMLDCPISGGPPLVVSGRATVFASGDPESIERAAPVLDAIAGRCVRTGDFGTGAHMKYVSIMLLAVHTVAAAEAMVLARRSGLDLEMVQSTLDTSISASAILAQRGPLMQQRAWTPAPGPVATLHEVLEQIEDEVSTLGLESPVFTAAKTVFDRAMAAGHDELDIACVHDHVGGSA